MFSVCENTNLKEKMMNLATCKQSIVYVPNVRINAIWAENGSLVDQSENPTKKKAKQYFVATFIPMLITLLCHSDFLLAQTVTRSHMNVFNTHRVWSVAKMHTWLRTGYFHLLQIKDWTDIIFNCPISEPFWWLLTVRHSQSAYGDFLLERTLRYCTYSARAYLVSATFPDFHNGTIAFATKKRRMVQKLDYKIPHGAGIRFLWDQGRFRIFRPRPKV